MGMDDLALDARVEQVTSRCPWHVASLSVLNGGRDLPEEYVDLFAKAWAPVASSSPLSRLNGNEVVGTLYTALGNEIHLEGGATTTWRSPRRWPRSVCRARWPPPPTLDSSTRRCASPTTVAWIRWAKDVGTPVIRIARRRWDRRLLRPSGIRRRRGGTPRRLWDGVCGGRKPGLLRTETVLRRGTHLRLMGVSVPWRCSRSIPAPNASCHWSRN